MPKIMLNYRLNGRTRLGRSLKRVLDEAATGLLGRNSWLMKKKKIVIMIMLKMMMLEEDEEPTVI